MGDAHDRDQDDDRIIRMSAQMLAQQQRIEDLTARVIRLETALEIALGPRSVGRIERRTGGTLSGSARLG